MWYLAELIEEHRATFYVEADSEQDAEARFAAIPDLGELELEVTSVIPVLRLAADPRMPSNGDMVWRNGAWDEWDDGTPFA